MVRSRSPLFVLEAEIIQDELVRAGASAKFMSTGIVFVDEQNGAVERCVDSSAIGNLTQDIDKEET